MPQVSKRNPGEDQLSIGFFHKLFLEITGKEKGFLGILLLGFVLAGVAQIHLGLAMAIGFLFAAYPVVANDSIQTIGTFIASNQDVAWWKKWLYIGFIFAVTVSLSWFMFDGDVSWQRLASKGFETAPTSFHYLQLAAPLFLLILTRLSIPVSTSLLILTAFATSPSAVQGVVQKSLTGYVLAFGGSILLWGLVTPFMEKLTSKPAKSYWRIIQWITTGILWSFWWQQDAANIAIYLPRSLELWHLIGFILVIFFGLGFMIKKGGERIQRIVDEKSRVVDVRSATLVDALYALLLWYFKIVNNVPMSTTWVFLGLLAGRELMINLRTRNEAHRDMKGTLKIVFKDLGGAILGLVVSLLIGASIHGLSWS